MIITPQPMDRSQMTSKSLKSLQNPDAAVQEDMVSTVACPGHSELKLPTVPLPVKASS